MFSEWFFGFGAVLWLRIGFVVSELFFGFGVVSEWYCSGFGMILEWFWSGFGLFLEPGFGAWFSGQLCCEYFYSNQEIIVPNLLLSAFPNSSNFK